MIRISNDTSKIIKQSNKVKNSKLLCIKFVSEKGINKLKNNLIVSSQLT